MKIDDNGVYNHDPVSPTNNNTVFTRVVGIDNTGSGYEASVTARVSWNRFGVNKTIFVKEYIYDWR